MEDHIPVPPRPGSADPNESQSDCTLGDLAVYKLWRAVGDGDVAACKIVLETPELRRAPLSQYQRLEQKLQETMRRNR